MSNKYLKNNRFIQLVSNKDRNNKDKIMLYIFFRGGLSNQAIMKAFWVLIFGIPRGIRPLRRTLTRSSASVPLRSIRFESAKHGETKNPAAKAAGFYCWRPQRDSNPRRRRERAVSWARLDDRDRRYSQFFDF